MEQENGHGELGGDTPLSCLDKIVLTFVGLNIILFIGWVVGSGLYALGVPFIGEDTSNSAQQVTTGNVVVGGSSFTDNSWLVRAALENKCNDIASSYFGTDKVWTWASTTPEDNKAVCYAVPLKQVSGIISVDVPAKK